MLITADQFDCLPDPNRADLETTLEGMRAAAELAIAEVVIKQVRAEDASLWMEKELDQARGELAQAIEARQAAEAQLREAQHQLEMERVIAEKLNAKLDATLKAHSAELDHLRGQLAERDRQLKAARDEACGKDRPVIAKLVKEVKEMKERLTTLEKRQTPEGIARGKAPKPDFR